MVSTTQRHVVRKSRCADGCASLKSSLTERIARIVNVGIGCVAELVTSFACSSYWNVLTASATELAEDSMIQEFSEGRPRKVNLKRIGGSWLPSNLN